ncbi:hypothetical protein [Christiangramia sabulilitoris]|uniref:7-cyano-7-deazaguanine synthase n=1 Tax=Christiangramia sabulilitoris TaxID=2583991 RepID=A0A550HZC6_9FLAO|nr:hypothetical protein [Christiangramia sabulilitoris]TRO63908.1 hypothetical protein FGM01_10380 [Christiangramia sabulilitoris]
MIIINQPEILERGNSCILESIIEINGEKRSMWFKTPMEYKEYLVTENVDGFLVGLLFKALQTNSNIKLKAPVSANLIYSLNHYLIPALVLSNPTFKKIRILTNEINNSNLNIKPFAATGMSCGVDSLATYYDHIKEEEPFKITHFTFFNVGSHLDFGGKKSRKIFNERLKRISLFSQKENKKLISVDSNLSEILQMNFQQTHSLRSASSVLILQKLIKNYYYSSAYRFDFFKLNHKDTSDSDILNLNMLSTESTRFFSSVAQFSRIERTLLISNYPETYNFLDVCVNHRSDKEFINCSTCYKCLRTQLTLDFAGYLSRYEKVFDLKKYQKNKNDYLALLYAKKNKSKLDIELINFLNEKGLKLSVMIYILMIKYHSLNNVKRLKNFFGR